MSICGKLIGIFYSVLFLITPLLVSPWTYELFEFPKMLFVYSLAIVITGCFLLKLVYSSRSPIGVWSTLKRVPLRLPLLIYLGFFLVSLAFSKHMYTSAFGYYTRFHGGLTSLLAYVALFLIFVLEFSNKPSRVIRSCWALLGAALIVGIYGVLQHFGIDNTYWVQDSASRVFSTLGQPNWLAAWLVMVIPLAWSFYFDTKTLLLKIFFFVVSMVTFTAFWFTYSLSGILGIVVMTILFLSYSPVLPAGRRKGSLFILVLGYSLVVLCYSGPYMVRMRRAWEGIALDWRVYATNTATIGGGDTGRIRRIVWRGAVDLWRSSPKVFLVGSGPETFAYAFLPYRPRSLNNTSEWNFVFNRAHNEYLDVLCEQGLLGLGSYLSLLGTFIWWGVRKVKMQRSLLLNGPPQLPEVFKSKGNRYLLAAFLSGWVGLLVTNFFGFSVVPTALLFWLYPAFGFSIYADEGHNG